jgi:rare lipoprotein A
MGQSYTPMTALQPYKARGAASWYGRRYHGRQTSSGEIYDMYGMTAAHTVLPIPSYARVTNVANNKSVIVRINDRGPFHSDRLIDLSYTAALKLGVLGGGKALVEVETIIPDAGTPAAPTYAAAQRQAPVARPAVTAAAAPASAAVIAVPLPAEPAAGAADAAPTSPVEPATALVVPVSAGVEGIFLQLGAFGSHDNAANYLARLRSQIEWLAPALQVYPKEGLFRVHAGPYASQAHARAAADRISEALGLKPIVLSR